MARKHQVAILGGGIAGIAAALRLLSDGARVCLIDEADSLGGIYRSFTYGDIPWDRHPHRILTTDADFLDFLDEVGVGALVRWAEGKIGLRMAKTTWSLATPKDLRRFAPLRFVERIKLGLVVYRAARGQHPPGIENQTARDWVCKQSGEASWNLLFEPMLRNLLGDAAEQCSALFLRECMRRAAVSRYGSRQRKGYGYVHGGLREAWAKAAGIFAEKKCEVLLGQRVERVHIESGNRVVVQTGAGSRDFDDVFITFPEPQARGMLDASIPQTAFAPEVPYLGMLSIACAGDWSLSDHAITYHTDRDVPYSGIVEMTRLVPTIDMAGRHLMFLMRFTGPRDAYQEMDDKAVAQKFFGGLEKMYDEETRDGIREHWVFREPAFRPVPVLGVTNHGEPAIQPAPGISCLNTRLLHFGAADGDGAVRMGRLVADQLTAAYDPSRYADDGKGDWRRG